MATLETVKQSIFSHGITVDKMVLEDSTKLLVSTTDAVSLLIVAPSNVYAGRPVFLVPTALSASLSGKASPYSAPSTSGGSNVSNIRPYGLAKSNRNIYADEVAGSFGAFGSGKLTVVSNGLVTVRPNVYGNPNGTTTTVHVYKSIETFYVGDPLYVSLANDVYLGMITKTVDASGDDRNDNTLLGYVTIPPTASNPQLEFRLVL